MSDDDPLRPWELRGSRRLIRDRWISLRADHCVTQRGVVLDPYYVLEYRDWVHVVALDEADRLLLVRQYRHGAGEMSLELPGGVMDEGESDPLAAGARELLEETGHRAASIRHLACLSPNPASHANRVHLLYAEGARLVAPLKLDNSEDITVERVPWREALELALGGGMIHAQHVGLLAIALAQVKGVTIGG
ncbi:MULTISPECIES: NUDIX hydrolase [Methylosinus]|uniref:NUDIX hydrolase n=1 Tax=Methylosinus trichosporium (strain ATCC 35070 / NCIMB 11131 / UNIQEM 75 / OB3b) TaxID=595536 RepID=A0A2D2D0H8_METT3|nr:MULTISPECIES: NUDIX hydrolase [Methylosinus]ATQ68511.1 NUDIX hydrolase [Methylosinus trichosporium OB3b]OBS53956.1 NUDIX hydrolase [Methylosinus sp. 3S-1]